MSLKHPKCFLKKGRSSPSESSWYRVETLHNDITEPRASFIKSFWALDGVDGVKQKGRIHVANLK